MEYISKFNKAITNYFFVHRLSQRYILSRFDGFVPEIYGEKFFFTLLLRIITCQTPNFFFKIIQKLSLCIQKE